MKFNYPKIVRALILTSIIFFIGLFGQLAFVMFNYPPSPIDEAISIVLFLSAVLTMVAAFSISFIYVMRYYKGDDEY